MNIKDWSDAWRLLGYIEGANDGECGNNHDIIKDAVDALAELLKKNRPEGVK